MNMYVTKLLLIGPMIVGEEGPLWKERGWDWVYQVHGVWGVEGLQGRENHAGRSAKGYSDKRRPQAAQ
jgi:hypothetical protein